MKQINPCDFGIPHEYCELAHNYAAFVLANKEHLWLTVAPHDPPSSDTSDATEMSALVAELDKTPQARLIFVIKKIINKGIDLERRLRAAEKENKTLARNNRWLNQTTNKELIALGKRAEAAEAAYAASGRTNTYEGGNLHDWWERAIKAQSELASVSSERDSFFRVSNMYQEEAGKLTFQLDEAKKELASVKADAAIGSAIQLAAGKLPDCFQIELMVEHGAATVKLYRDGVSLDVDSSPDNSLAEDINDAINFAISAAKGGKT